MRSKLEIDLADLAPSALEQEIAALSKPNPLDETMARALESEKGIALEFDSKEAAARMRHRLYRRRMTVQAAGIHSFDVLTIIQHKPQNSPKFWLILKREEVWKEIVL